MRKSLAQMHLCLPKVVAGLLRGGFQCDPGVPVMQRGHRRRVRALRLPYARSMSEVASRELCNDTAGVLRRVRDGEDVTITVKGRPVAVLTAVRPQRRRWLSKVEFLSRLRRAQADPGLREDLLVLAGDTPEDLGPIR